MHKGGVVLGHQRFKDWSDHSAETTHSSAVVVAARKKMTDPNCVISETNRRGESVTAH